MCNAALCILVCPWRQAVANSEVLVADEADAAIVLLVKIELYDCLVKALRNCTEAPGRSCIAALRRWRDMDDEVRKARRREEEGRVMSNDID